MTGEGETKDLEISDLQRTQALDIAVKMLHQQHTRWYQWTIFFFGTIGSVFVVWNQIRPLLPLCLVLLLSSILSVIWTVVAQNIRAQTRCWDDTVHDIEIGKTDSVFPAFRVRLSNFNRLSDYLTTIQFWKRESNASVTRLLIFVASLFALTSILAFVLVFFIQPDSQMPVPQQEPSAERIVSTMDWQSFREVVVAVASGLAVIIAAVGLATWRRQLKGKTEYELARRILSATYRLRGAIRSVRDFLSGSLPEEDVRRDLANEGNSEESIEKMISSRSPMELSYNVVWRPVADSRAQLTVEMREAEVLWREAAPTAIQPLLQCVEELQSAIGEYFWRKRDGQLTGERASELNSIILRLSDDPTADEFGAEIGEAVSRIESFARQYLKL